MYPRIKEKLMWRNSVKGKIVISEKVGILE